MSSQDFNSNLKIAAKKISSYCKDEKDAEVVIKSALEEMGIDDSEDGLDTLYSDYVEFSDFNEAMNASGRKIPKPRLKLVWGILKDNKEKEKESKPEEPTNNGLWVQKPVGQWGDYELLEKYEKNGENDVIKELAKRTNGKRCIILDKTKQKANVEASIFLVREARQHIEVPRTYKVGDEIVNVYKVGEFPEEFYYECPIHSRTLLVNGYCDNCGLDYNVDEYEKNVFLRLISKNTQINDMLPYIDLTLEQLKKKFPKICLIYKDLEEDENLPTLKRKPFNVKKNDPFREDQNREF